VDTVHDSKFVVCFSLVTDAMVWDACAVITASAWAMLVILLLIVGKLSLVVVIVVHMHIKVIGRTMGF